LAVASAAAQPSYELRVGVDEVYVGESFLVELVIEGAKSYSQPTFPAIPNCAVQPAGQSSSTTFVNGRMSQSVTLTYTLTPRRAGELVIPPITFEVNGRRVTTNGVSVQVRPATERSTVATGDSGETLLLAEIKCRETSLVVGQQARFTLTFWIKAPTGLPTRLDANDLYGLMHNRRSGFGPFPEPQNAESVPQTLADGSKASYYEFRTSVDVRLEREGPVEFDGLTIAMEYPRRLSRDVFGRLRLAEADTLAIRPTVVAPDVAALPVAGRPAGFSGAVGNFKLNVRPDATIVRVGDPISLTIEVRGNGPLDALAAPILAAQPKLTADFRVPSETLTGRTVGERRIFTQTIRAKRADVTEVPPIEFPYFDPKLGEYAVARSNAVPLTVRASEVATADELLDLSTDAPPAERVESLQGLRGLKTSETELLTVFAPVTMRQVVWVVGAPPVAFMCFWGCSAWVARGGDSARRRRQRALPAAARRIRQASGSPAGGAETGAALASYLADRLDQPPGRFTGRAAIDLLVERRVSDETLRCCRELIDRYETAAYGGATGDDGLAELAERCLHRLEGERL
jgi:hypothetical protein